MAEMRGPWRVEIDHDCTPPNIGMIESRPCQYWFQVLEALEDALRRGATEVRIRPVKP